MQLSKLHEKKMHCSFLPQIPFNSTSSLSAPLLLPLLHAGVSFISGYLSPVAPKLFPAALTCCRRRRAAAHLSTLASLSPKFRYRTHRTTSTESGGRVFAFSLPPPPPSSVTGSAAGGNSLPPVPRRVHCLCPFRRRRRVVFVGLIRRLG